MANLLESYKNRIALAESLYSKEHNGEKLSNQKKLATAICLRNVDGLLNEAFNNSVGTQRADLGMYKKFSINLTNVVVPNLIAFDLVLVHPMTSISGYINYLEYTLGSNKGASKQGDVINSPFGLGTTRDGEPVKFDYKYTSAQVEDAGVAGGTAQTEFKLAWTPVIAGTVMFSGTVGGAVVNYVDGGDGKIYELASGTAVSRMVNPDGSVTVALPAGATEKGTIVYGDTRGAEAKITLTTGVDANKAYTVKYAYNNVVIPQNDIPTINVEMKSMALIAKARRIAVYYSQIAAYQAKTDYGFDLGDQLTEKAMGELSYEIDTEVTQLLIDNAAAVDVLKFNKAVPVGISKAEHYEGFTETIAAARQVIYDRTKRFAPNYMLIASDVLNMFGFLKGWSAAPAKQINGPYFAGTLEGLKVFVTPNINPGTFVIGVNGNDMMTSAAVYAPYMPIVPTQLLGFADGAMSQGFSTMYDLKILNANLLVKGTVVNDPATANEQVVKTAVQGTVSTKAEG